jgi:hypothetical protein
MVFILACCPCMRAMINVEFTETFYSFLCYANCFCIALFKGNVVLCGLRNGSIAPVDVRQKRLNHTTGVTGRRTVPMLSTRRLRKWKKQVCNTSTKHPLMPCMFTSLK